MSKSSHIVFCRFLFDPTKVLNDVSRVKHLMAVVDPHDLFDKVDFSIRPLTHEKSSLIEKADVLFAMLRMRVPPHVRGRVKKSQQSHLVWHWATKNLAIVSASMIVMNHLKRDISCLGSEACLLAKPDSTNFLPVANNLVSMWGCYLHHDTNEEKWIRSGSAAGEGGFGGRLKTHLQRAKAARNDDGSRFYDDYPDRSSVRATSKAKRGLFEYLRPLVAFYLNKEASTKEFSKNYDAGGLFLYSEEECAFVRQMQFNGKIGERKFMQMVAYLFELGYDLAIGPNVSCSPGFEGCGVLFDKQARKNE